MKSLLAFTFLLGFTSIPTLALGQSIGYREQTSIRLVTALHANDEVISNNAMYRIVEVKSEGSLIVVGRTSVGGECTREISFESNGSITIAEQVCDERS